MCSAGRMRCGRCGRRCRATGVHGHAYYRCNFTEDYPDSDSRSTRATSTSRKTRVVPASTDGSASCSTTTTSTTPATVSSVSRNQTRPPKNVRPRSRAAIADCDRKLANYRALLDHEDAVTVAASWIADTQRQRKQLERQRGQQVPSDKLTAEQVEALVKALKDIVSVLAAPSQRTSPISTISWASHCAYDPDGTVTRRVAAPWGNRTCREGRARASPGPAPFRVALGSIVHETGLQCSRCRTRDARRSTCAPLATQCCDSTQNGSMPLNMRRMPDIGVLFAAS